MKILVITQNFYPDDFNINEITFRMAKDGHDVHVLTGLPNYPKGVVPVEYKWPKVITETVNGVTVHRTKIHERRDGIFHRFLNYASFAINSKKRLKDLPKDFDVIFSYQLSPISMAHAARALRKQTNIPLSMYVLDIWPESLKAWHMTENNPVYKIISKYSKNIYSSADQLLISSEPFAEYLHITHGLDPEEMHYLPQHSIDMLSEEDLPNPFKDDKKHFIYAGNIGAVQMLDVLVDAAELLQTEYADRSREIQIDIFGDGSEFSRIKELVEQKKLDNIMKLHGRVSKDELRAYYQHAYAFLLTLKRDNYIGDTLPAKLQGYMSAAKPVIAMAGAGASAVLEESQAGLTVEQGRSDILAENILRLEYDKDLVDTMGKNARAYYDQHFTLDEFMRKLYSYLETLIERGVN